MDRQINLDGSVFHVTWYVKQLQGIFLHYPSCTLFNA